MNKIALHRVYYPVTSLGYGKRLGIWVQGCSRKCDGCISPEAQQYRPPNVDVETIIKCFPADIVPDGLTISGGEPFDQADAVREIVEWFIRKYNSDVLMYTGYTLDELTKRCDEATDWLLMHVAALVDGPYIKEANTGTGLYGSSNQKVYINAYKERYLNFSKEKRSLQCVQENNRLFLIGIPPQEMKSENND